jgi:ribosome-binding protein aMBF1 (putative translation factor)
MVIVEAIDGGKIVKVSEDYARREGLLIIRRNVEAPVQVRQKEEERRLLFDDYRKPLKPGKSQVLKELKDHFYWDISQARKLKGITRKQLGLAVGVSELDIKMVENGMLPKDDFILINKIQNYLGLHLRKEQSYIDQPLRKLVEKEMPNKEVKTENKRETRKDNNQESKDLNVFGDDIEIIE